MDYESFNNCDDFGTDITALRNWMDGKTLARLNVWHLSDIEREIDDISIRKMTDVERVLMRVGTFD